MACRRQHEDNDRDPPCDTEAGCRLGAVELFEENRLAVEMHARVKLLGAAAFELSDLALTPGEAEDLAHRMVLIEHMLAAARAEEEERRRDEARRNR